MLRSTAIINDFYITLSGSKQLHLDLSSHITESYPLSMQVSFSKLFWATCKI